MRWTSEDSGYLEFVNDILNPKKTKNSVTNPCSLIPLPCLVFFSP
jgi:hypothetical protein